MKSTVCEPCSPDIEENPSRLQRSFSRYSPSEQRAILVHKFYLSIQLDREATLEETLRSWESGPSAPWRRDKMCRDREAQYREIELHKYFLSMQYGHDVGWEFATEDWVSKHAEAWREWWEQQRDSGA